MPYQHLSCGGDTPSLDHPARNGAPQAAQRSALPIRFILDDAGRSLALRLRCGPPGLELLDVPSHDAPARTGSSDLVQVDIQAAGQFSHGGDRMHDGAGTAFARSLP